MDHPGHASRARLVEALGEVARSRGVSRAVVALAWLTRHPAGIIPIIGSVNPVHIREAAGADGVCLERDDWYRLLTAARGSRLP